MLEKLARGWSTAAYLTVVALVAAGLWVSVYLTHEQKARTALIAAAAAVTSGLASFTANVVESRRQEQARRRQLLEDVKGAMALYYDAILEYRTAKEWYDVNSNSSNDAIRMDAVNNFVDKAGVATARRSNLIVPLTRAGSLVSENLRASLRGAGDTDINGVDIEELKAVIQGLP